MAEIRKEFLVERQGRVFALLAGLLDAAHADGLKSIETQLLQIGDEVNNQTWLFRATVTTDRGTFSAHGDANPANVSRQMLSVLPRMAESRAIARALRWAVNASVVALEELADDEHAEAAHAPSLPKPVNTPPGQPAPRPAAPAPQEAPMTGVLATQAQVRAIYGIARQIGLDEATVEEMCTQKYGTKPADISRREASELISSLQATKGGS